MKKPWFRRSNLTWYVEFPGGRQVPIGKDERFSAKNPPPRKKLKDPPDPIKKAYHELCRNDHAPKDRTVGDVFDEYLKSMTDYTAGTRKVTRLHLKWFRQHVGETLKISRLEPYHVTAHLRSHPDWSQQTRRIAIAKIKAALNYGVREGWIDANPLKEMKKPPSGRRTEIITPEEQDRIEAAAAPEFREFLIAMRESGCRPGELVSATIENLDLKTGTLKVKNKTATTTGEKWRTVYLSPKLCQLLERLTGKRSEGTIFLNCEGNPWTVPTLTSRMWNLRRKLGLGSNCVLYAYRHRFASNSINNANISPALLARQLGHSDLTMLLKHYLHEDPEAMRKAIEEATKKG